jgi:hypothetical protein
MILGMFQCPAPIINLTAAPRNNEWLKILVTVLLGFILGVIAEPIKAWIQRRTEERRIHRSVTYETMLLFMARTSVKGGLIPEENFWANIEIPAFEKHWEENREYFYSDLTLISKAYQLRMVGILKKGLAEGKISREEATVKLDAVIAELMKGPHQSRWQRFKNRFR